MFPNRPRNPYLHIQRSDADLASRVAGVSFGPARELFDIAKNAGRDTKFMEKLLSSLVCAILIKIVKRLDSLDSLDRKAQYLRDARNCSKDFHHRRALECCSK
jgi:hypothetical protein